MILRIPLGITATAVVLAKKRDARKALEWGSIGWEIGHTLEEMAAEFGWELAKGAAALLVTPLGNIAAMGITLGGDQLADYD